MNSHDVVHDPQHGFVFHHAPTTANPFLSPEEIAEQKATTPRAEVALQEFDAEFIDTGGATIFPLSMLLSDGEPRPDDFPCQAVGLAIDSNSGRGGEGDRPLEGDAGDEDGGDRQADGLEDQHHQRAAAAVAGGCGHD